MKLHKIIIFVLFVLSIESVQLTSVGSSLAVVAAKIVKKSGKFGFQQARTVRTKPTRVMKKKASKLQKTTSQVLDNDLSWVSWAHLKQVAVKSKELAVHKAQELKEMLAGNLVENKVKTDVRNQTVDSFAHKTMQAAKTDASQTASGFFNRNATTNHAAHTVIHNYAAKSWVEVFSECAKSTQMKIVAFASFLSGYGVHTLTTSKNPQTIVVQVPSSKE